MLIVAGRVGTRRHITVAANGDAFIVMRGGRGGVLAMRDTTGDGTADVMARFGAGEGLRNTVALAFRSQDGSLYRAVHGRDQLGQNCSNIYTLAQSAEEPAEEFVRIEDGNDFGWPYCYYDPEVELKVLAPEYRGDGRVVGSCSQVAAPLIGFPAHWAAAGLLFYAGTQFPQRYRAGAFIAFHGSWNRAPFPQDGFNVVFVPFESLDPTGSFETFADGFRGDDGVIHRPVGIAEGPDGSLYTTDDRAGRVYRIIYSGN